MKKILIADDEDLIRRSLSRIFLKFGYEVFEAQDGAQALELWLKHKPDLVLLDYFMPQWTGLEVLSRVPMELKRNVIVISAFLEDSDKLKFQELGVSTFYKKPFENIFELVDLVKKKIEVFT